MLLIGISNIIYKCQQYKYLVKLFAMRYYAAVCYIVAWDCHNILGNASASPDL